MKTLAILVGQMFDTMYWMIISAEHLFRGTMSYMMKMGPNTYTVVKYRKGYSSSYRKCFQSLLAEVPRLRQDVDLKSEEFINNFTNKLRDKDLERMIIPDEIKAMITPLDLRYLAQYHPVIERHGKVIRMTTPDYITTDITAPFYLWYYIDKYNKQDFIKQSLGAPLSLEVYIDGPMIVNTDIYHSSFRDWYICIRRAGEVVSRSTEFRLLDLYLMKAVDTPKLVLINPLLQTTKADAQEQTCDINLSRWKNPDIEIVSPTHDITIEDVPRFPGRQIIRAVKK